MCTITAQPLTVALVAAFTLVTSTTGNCDQPTASASIRAISIRPNRTIISDRYGPTLDIGSTQIRRSNRAEPHWVSANWWNVALSVRHLATFQNTQLSAWFRPSAACEASTSGLAWLLRYPGSAVFAHVSGGPSTRHAVHAPLRDNCWTSLYDSGDRTAKRKHLISDRSVG
jgi:hypothetical protein